MKGSTSIFSTVAFQVIKKQIIMYNCRFFFSVQLKKRTAVNNGWQQFFSILLMGVRGCMK
jgi:hypothetical protein